MLQACKYRKGNKSGKLFQTFRSLILGYFLITAAAYLPAQQSFPVVKIANGKDVYLKSLLDTNTVFGPIINQKNGGDGHIAVEVAPGKWNLLNKKLLPVFPKPIDQVSQVHRGRFMAASKGKWGVADTNAKWILKPEFEQAFSFSEGLAFVMKKDFWGVIDLNGDYVIKPFIKNTKAISTMKFVNGNALIVNEQGYQVMNKIGNFINEKTLQTIIPVFGHQYFGKEDVNFSLYDQNFKRRTDAIFEWVDEDLSNNILRVKNKQKFGFFELTQAELILACEFEQAAKFLDGFAVLKEEKGYTFTDSTGDIFSSHWPYLKNIGKGLFAFSLQTNAEKSLGLMDHLGKIIIPSGFSDIKEFRGSWAPVFKNGKYLMIDHFGALLFEESFDELLDYNSSYAVVGDGNKSWVIDNSGNIIIKPTTAKITLL